LLKLDLQGIAVIDLDDLFAGVALFDANIAGTLSELGLRPRGVGLVECAAKSL